MFMFMFSQRHRVLGLGNQGLYLEGQMELSVDSPDKLVAQFVTLF